MKNLKDQYIKRILQSGADSLSDKELLEFILTFTENVPDRAEGLLNRCGSFRGIIDRDASRIADEKIINENTAVMFGILAAICRCSEETSVKNMCLSTAERAKKFFRGRFIGFSEEHFIITAVNSNFRSTDFLHFSSDSYDEVNINMRKMLKFATETGKRTFFLAHNHPDSSSEPSDQDILMTKDLAKAFGKLDLVIADHIIVGNNITSMREYPDLDIFDDIKGYKFEDRDNYYK